MVQFMFMMDFQVIKSIDKDVSLKQKCPCQRMESEMAYTVTNFKTKKALKEAVKTWETDSKVAANRRGAVRCYQPGLGPDLSNFTGKVSLEGPHYPAAHTWYAQAELVDGVVVKVS